MLFRVLFFILGLSFSAEVFAQGENNIWAFGINSGLDFNSGVPVFVPTQMETAEGCATLCDADGRLLCYTNGNNVWDRNQQVMPNGDSLLGNSGGWSNHGSATQGVAIVPFVDNPDRYYIFTLDCAEAISAPVAPGYFRYSVLDMSLNNGLGDILAGQKNIVLDSGTSEKMAVVSGADCAYWVLTHTYGTKEFRAWKISASGIASSYISSICGYYDNSRYHPRYSYMGGEMKVSHDHRYIALVNGWPKSIELCSFDNRTGKVSDAGLLAEEMGTFYGLSFSPDDSKLYAWPNPGALQTKHQVIQFDLAHLPDIEAVRQSLIPVGDSLKCMGMRIGPDRKIYMDGYNEQVIYRINNPNLSGNACAVEALYFTTPPSTYFQVGFGMPVLPMTSKGIHTRSRDTFLCESGGLVKLSAEDGFNTYLWNDGSADRERTIYTSGTKWVTCTSSCDTLVDTFHIRYSSCKNCLMIPTAFTPNNDGLNDAFHVRSLCPLEWYAIRIYNRWGEQVFYSDDIEKSWDGNFKGIAASTDTYYYYIAYLRKEAAYRLSEMKKGAFTLLR